MTSGNRINAKAQRRKGAKFFVFSLRVFASLRLCVKIQPPRHVLAVLPVLFASLPLFAQTNSEPTNTLPKLLPPYAELPPTFWEQHGTSIVVTLLAVVVVLALGLWLLLRPKPKAILPPEVQARMALEALRQRPEDGACLSNISQILRNYFIAAFQLPPGELTTTEFCRVISGHEPIGAELSTALADFLRRCDERKFSPTISPVPPGAVTRALELVALGESKRAQLRQIAAAKAGNQTSSRA
jgi:hypothetical protein